MADKPILFSGPMVRALIAGTKTQTRRALNPQPELLDTGRYHVFSRGGGLVGLEEDEVGAAAVDYLRIAVGDRLYVRENVIRFDKGSCDQWIWYRAGGNDLSGWVGKHFPDQSPDAEWSASSGPAGGAPYSVPSIHMPRWASRITLTITDVRVERLQDISEEDAVAEGIVPVQHREGGSIRFSGVGAKFGLAQQTAKAAYAHLWDSINGEDAWAENPWVAAYTFTVQMGNIDQLEAA
jgi:hypothetical protein